MVVWLPSVSSAQAFGKNKVNYAEYRWSYIESEHFDIYFAEGGEDLAKFVAGAAEDALASLERNLEYALQNRVPVIVYNSHNSFMETNVILELLSEGVGGFTELAKNRVVIPFEGPYEKFRHVIHHELTHAVMFELLTEGGGLQAFLSGKAVQPPLWVSEGLAEYQSLGWDLASDDVMRDAAISDYLPSIREIGGGLFAYKGGQSILRFIAAEYGEEKIGELISSIKTARGFERALKSCLGVGAEELSEAWSKHLKREYWPELAQRKEPDEIARQLTDHRKEGAYLNMAPAFSPQGDKIAFVSNRRGYADIYLMSAIDGLILGLLVEGEQTETFESLLLLRPGITWSPEGREIAFIAKSGPRNALYTLDVRKRRVTRTLTFDLDGMFTPNWSKDGRIVVVGLKDGRSDLYLIDPSEARLHQLTDDPYDEQAPQWSPDGSKIVFSSDRPDASLTSSEGETFSYGKYDIFTMDVDGLTPAAIRRITSDPADDLSPTWSPDGRKIAFVSRRTGIGNIYAADLDSSIVYPLTDLLTSCGDLHWSPDGKKIAFSSFHNGGYNVYVLKDPLSHRKRMEDIPPTSLFLAMADESGSAVMRGPDPGTEPAQSEVELEAKPYTLRLSPEFFTANAGFSTFYGFQGLAQLSLSDVLGNHRLFFASDLNFSVKNSDLVVAYYYLPRRTDYGAASFHMRTLFLLSSGDLAADRVYGINAFASRPFSKFSRLDMGAMYLTVEREKLSRSIQFGGYRAGFFGGMTRGLDGELVDRRRTWVFDMNLVNDTTLPGYFAPFDGSRSILGVQYSPGTHGFTTVSADYRKYYRVLKYYSFALRFAGGSSFGPNAQKFFLGGVNNEINPRFAEDSDVEDMEIGTLFFSSFEAPLRGAYLFEMVGDSFLLSNVEFRFPFIRQLALGWPLPLTLHHVGGILFFDLGGAFDRDDRNLADRVNGMPQLRDLTGSYGFGCRLNLGLLVLRFDAAWRTDLQNLLPGRYHFSAGLDF